MNPFDKILDKAKDLFGGNKVSSAIGIDIGSTFVKMVELKEKGGKAYLETYGALALGPYAGLPVGSVTNLPEDKIAQAIKDLYKEITAVSKSGSIAIPASASLIFTVELPSQVKDSDTRTAVETEARKFIPVPISEVSLDTWVIPHEEYFDEEIPDALRSGQQNEDLEKNKTQKTKVLVAAIHNDTLAKYQQIVNAGELTVPFFEIETFSTVRSINQNDIAPIMIMDFGASRTKITIIEHGIIRTFHIINRGSQDITNSLSHALSITFDQAEEMKKKYGILESAPDANVKDVIKGVIDYIFSEANSSILDYERKTKKSISKVFIVGGGALLLGLPQYATKEFRAEVSIGNAFAKTEAPAFLQNMLSVTGPEFAVAVGLALRALE